MTADDSSGNFIMGFQEGNFMLHGKRKHPENRADMEISRQKISRFLCRMR